jgi:hypothetical protein
MKPTARWHWRWSPAKKHEKQRTTMCSGMAAAKRWAADETLHCTWSVIRDTFPRWKWRYSPFFTWDIWDIHLMALSSCITTCCHFVCRLPQTSPVRDSRRANSGRLWRVMKLKGVIPNTKWICDSTSANSKDSKGKAEQGPKTDHNGCVATIPVFWLTDLRNKLHFIILIHSPGSTRGWLY